MRRVQCHECGKGYNFDKDDFCPRCGAFTQPQRSSRIGADGSVIRVDGINESNHKNSFVHAELHHENKKRAGSSLEGVRPSNLLSGINRTMTYKKPQMEFADIKKVIGWVISAVVVLNLLSSLVILYI